MAMLRVNRTGVLTILALTAGLGGTLALLANVPPASNRVAAPPRPTLLEPELTDAERVRATHALLQDLPANGLPIPVKYKAARSELSVPAEPATTGLAPPRLQPLTLETVNAASFGALLEGGRRAGILRAQILLDRAGFSPGAIDAVDNANFRKAVVVFQRQRGLDATGRLDAGTWDALLATSAEPVLAEYAITPADIRGPFAPDIPEDLEDQARLKRLAYRGPRDLLAERFHVDRRLLSALNPQAAFDQAGTRIIVPQVGRPDRTMRVTRIEVDKPHRRLRAFDKDGRLVAAYPASIGSLEKPTPSGAYVVRHVARNPEWRYNPRFAFKEVKTSRAFRVAAGPNNPLGTVWIGISKPSYGIHGTPVAEEVGTAASHGCVRLTNWDAQALASMVRRGTRVEFIE